MRALRRPIPSARARRRALRFLLATGVASAGVALTVAAATPASAHSGGLPDAPYYLSTVTSISPAVQGLGVTVDPSGTSVTLVNHTGEMVQVLGYVGEPYLRISPTGVDENTHSVSAFLNGSLVIEGLPQQLASAQQPPLWKHVANTPAFTWHDHRVHWMAEQRPPMVAADPTRPHTVFDWSMSLRVADRPVVVSGVLTWLGAPAGTGWQTTGYLSLATVVVLSVMAIAVRARASRRRIDASVSDGAQADVTDADRQADPPAAQGSPVSVARSPGGGE